MVGTIRLMKHHARPEMIPRVTPTYAFREELADISVHGQCNRLSISHNGHRDRKTANPSILNHGFHSREVRTSSSSIHTSQPQYQWYKSKAAARSKAD